MTLRLRHPSQSVSDLAYTMADKKKLADPENDDVLHHFTGASDIVT